MYDPKRIYEIPISEVFADSEFNVRGHIDPTDCIELAKSIKERGLDQPITVQPWDQKPGKKFRILAGHRRFKAHQLIPAQFGPETIVPGTTAPGMINCMVREGISELDAHVLNITENIQRKDLNILQEAKGLEVFMRAGWTEHETAQKFGMSRGWVQVRYMLLKLPREIQIEAAAGLLNNNHIRELAKLNSYEEQMAFVRKVKDKILFGKKREVKADSVAVKNEKRTRTPAEIEDMMDTIREKILSGVNNEITKALAWAAGFISDLEFHKYLSDYANRKGRIYKIPDGLEGTKAEGRANVTVRKDNPMRTVFGQREW